MIRKRKLPLGILAVGLLLTLAVIGIVNGLWSKNLVINGSVETGDLNVDWTGNTNSGDQGSLDRCTEFGSPDGPDLGTAPDCPEVRKDVGNLECFVDENDSQILHFIIHNGYPSYEADCEYHFANTGSIPFNIIGAAVDGANSDPPITNCGDDTAIGPTIIIVCDQIKVGYFDNVGQQVDPGGELSGSLIVHVQQPAEQSTCTADTAIGLEVHVVDVECTELVDYEFQVKICVAQWNEEADYEQCVGSLQHEGPGGEGDADYDNVYEGDNCPDAFNPGQEDQDALDDDDLNPDGSTMGDACDPDNDSI